MRVSRADQYALGGHLRLARDEGSCFVYEPSGCCDEVERNDCNGGLPIEHDSGLGPKRIVSFGRQSIAIIAGHWRRSDRRNLNLAKSNLQ